jgi:UDP-N-acetylmuramate--alanine ligase
MSYPGRHNVENATAAIAAALSAGAFSPDIPQALADFKGVKRRFEYIFRGEKTVYIDDYAHHPAELEAVISAVKMMYPERRVTGIFQPHLFSRTQDFAREFAAALDRLDEVILLPIYPAREQPIPGVTSEMLLALMKNPHKRLVPKAELLPVLQAGQWDVLLTAGAGDIDTFVEPIKQLLQKA